ncbi:MAG: hypothetical protein LBQ66_14115 [Planctomycetaceae bacterium]|jgi:hypothetical protein|nr:hypothetical protein [Planctomycetaceae bacterium]
MAGIDTTIDVLSRSKNRTAYRVLESGLDSSNDAIRQLIGKALVSFRGGRGIAELIRRFDPSDAGIVSIFRDNRDKINTGLRAAIAGNDVQLARNAMQIVLTLDFYEVTPVLLTIYMDQGNKTGDDKELEEVILILLEHLAAAAELRKNRRLVMKMILPELFRHLWGWLKSYRAGDPDIIFRVLIYFNQFLHDDFEILRDHLTNTNLSSYEGLNKFILSVVDMRIFDAIMQQMNVTEPYAWAITAFSQRCDEPFLSFVFEHLKEPISDALRTNLAGIKRLEWVADAAKYIPTWSEKLQLDYTNIIYKLKVPAVNLPSMLLEVFRLGTGAARVEALAGIAKIAGDPVDQLIWKATEDHDTKVQIKALYLLRERNVPNATLRILQFANNPNNDIRETVRKLIPEIRLSNFLDIFETINEEQRQKRFQLIRASNPQIVEELTNVLLFGEPIMKAKGLLCVEYGNMINALEDVICDVLIKGETPPLRIKAAQLLKQGTRAISRSSLVQSFHRDPNPDVRETAKKSLESRPPTWGNQTQKK